FGRVVARHRRRRRRTTTRRPLGETTTPGEEFVNVTDKFGRVVARHRRRRRRTTTRRPLEPKSTPGRRQPSTTTPEDHDLYVYYIDKFGKRRRRPRRHTKPSHKRTRSTSPKRETTTPGE
ncbi:unnamed protein product, partial [Trichobilharzia szidati]